MDEPGAERIEPGAEAAHRDDVARDVARLWLDPAAVAARNRGWLHRPLAEALDRLAAAYAAEVP